ncbi:AAA family ATPase [Acidaminococcus fermentans]|jgi:5-methylcytosine-specific restriction protein B|uniref:AAA family ATPase n=1 Tax=Acidaminococcus fermentans TaxID=905 RepID=UPI003E3CD549
MFDQSRLQKVLVQYKKDFVPKHWDEEKYKWEAVKCFQDNWDIKAANFKDMLSRSLSKTYNLLSSMNNFPADMILGFAKTAPEDVRSMYIDLFDEDKDVYERIEHFKMQASILLEKYGNGAKQHYQYENAITTYLWLRYPDKYYIFKFSEVKAVADELQSNYVFKRGAYAENLRNFYALYNEICGELKKDAELFNLFKFQITESCYPDPELKTLTVDIGFYISQNYAKCDKHIPSIWKISHGAISEQNRSLFETRKVVVVHGQTAPKGTSGESQGQQFTDEIRKGDYFYLCNGNSINLLGRFTSDSAVPNPEQSNGWVERSYEKIADSRDTSAYKGVQKWWTPNDNSTCIKVEKKDEKLFEKLILKPYFAMGLEDLDGKKDRKPRYWWLNANPRIWSFSDLQVGEVEVYTLFNENGNKRRIYQNFLDARAGDVFIGYEAAPVKQIVALGKVKEPSDGTKIFFEKTESLENPIDYQTLKACQELSEMEFFQNPSGSLFKLTNDEYEFLMDMIRDENPLPTGKQYPSYTKKDFLSEVYMTEKQYDRLVGVLGNKMNIILQGAPGVGKTFAAKRLAYSLMGEKDDSRIEFVQFHQNYSYEDFMMGYKPSGSSFELKYGVFYKFCKKAENQPDKKFFFIIDEINRGNLSKIFGELLMLIEKSYRGKKAALAYNGESFAVPKNLYIIGMMNTADRSLAMIDYALRRRFSFFDMEPAFGSKGFEAYQKTLENKTFDDLVQKISALNDDIRNDPSLGKGFCIGHSYFCGRTKETCTEEWMESVVDYDILPMLTEYWFDDDSKAERWGKVLHGVFNEKG